MVRVQWTQEAEVRQRVGLVHSPRTQRRSGLPFDHPRAVENISTLPPGIGKLTNLTHLRLWDNQLSTLPPEIGQLTTLTNLSLWDNQLTTLPPEIAQLTNLTGLSLHYYDVKVNGHFTFYDRSIKFQERDFNFKVDLGKENEWIRITTNINPKVSKEPLSTHEFLLSDKARVYLDPGDNLTLYSQQNTKSSIVFYLMITLFMY